MNGMIRIVAAGSMVMLACAHSEPRTAADDQTMHSVRTVDERPELVGCARYTPPRHGMDQVIRVETTFAVSATGQVQDVMLGRISPAGASQRVPTDISDIVRSCVYRPAMLDGTAVGVRDASRSFYVAVNDLGLDGIGLDRSGRKVESEKETEKPAKPVPPPRAN